MLPPICGVPWPQPVVSAIASTGSDNLGSSQRLRSKCVASPDASSCAACSATWSCSFRGPGNGSEFAHQDLAPASTAGAIRDLRAPWLARIRAARQSHGPGHRQSPGTKSFHVQSTKSQHFRNTMGPRSPPGAAPRGAILEPRRQKGTSSSSGCFVACLGAAAGFPLAGFEAAAGRAAGNSFGSG